MNGDASTYPAIDRPIVTRPRMTATVVRGSNIALLTQRRQPVSVLTKVLTAIKRTLAKIGLSSIALLAESNLPKAFHHVESRPAARASAASRMKRAEALDVRVVAVESVIRRQRDEGTRFG